MNKPVPPSIRIVCSCGLEKQNAGEFCWNCFYRALMFITLIVGAAIALGIAMMRTFGN